MAVDSLLASSSEFQGKDSGWTKKNFNYFEITIIKLENISASGYIQAPKNIRARNGLINVRNDPTGHPVISWVTCNNAVKIWWDEHTISLS